MSRRWLAVAAVVAVALATAGCGSSHAAWTGDKSGSTTKTTAYPTVLNGPEPAGKNPSPIAIEICSAKAQSQIATVLGVTAHVGTPTWAGHLYSCRYSYPNGSFELSVKELSSWSETYAYFDGAQKSSGDKGSLGNLGQGAFTTSGDSVVVRKDWKVLYVNISGLPAQFGKPATSRGAVAYTVASIILGCWAGD